MSAGDTETGDIVSAVIDAKEQLGITHVERVRLVAADATCTVSLRLDDLFVADDLVVSRTPRADFLANQLFGSRLNGTLPIGLARRCAALLADVGQQDASTAVLAACDRVRGELDAGLADPSALLAGRASGAQLAVRAAAALVAAGGGASLARSSHHQRLMREAAFTLVAASRPELKRLLVETLTVDDLDPVAA
jgi:hypothetical protein